MCQAYAAEAAAMRSAEDFQRRREREMDGRLARQEGRPRADWETLVYTVRHDLPDGAFNTPSWWLAHWFDGPLIKAWLAGWDEEDRRIAAGGAPLTRDERAGLADDASFLYRTRHELKGWGQKAQLPGGDLVRLLRLCGNEDAAQYGEGVWLLPTGYAHECVDAALAVVRARLEPHRVLLEAA